MCVYIYISPEPFGSRWFSRISVYISSKQDHSLTQPEYNHPNIKVRRVTLIPFSSTALNLIPPVILPMSFITKVEIHFLVWDPIQNHTWLPVSMSFLIWNSSLTLCSGTLSVLRITNHLFCRMTSVQVV